MNPLLQDYLLLLTGILLLSLFLGLLRIMWGPSHADRMLAAQLFGTLGVAILILMAALQQQTALLNAALVLALLAPITAITFVKLAGKKSPGASS